MEERLKDMEMDELVSFVHIGCTSEDITNLAYSNMIKAALQEVWIPTAEKLIDAISEIAIPHANTVMPAHIQEQPATLTTVGKDLMVYVYRLRNSLEIIKSIKTYAKFNGAMGNYAAISVASPNENCLVFSRVFIED